MTGQTTFALDLHRVAVPDPDANACWSQFSVACWSTCSTRWPRSARTEGWQTIALPAGSEVEALVLLPNQSLEQPLPPSAFDVRDSTAVELSLPKVDVREKFEPRDTLERLGVGTMFTPGADLGGLSPDPLFVSAVTHEAVLRLDEQGLEGAAATAVTTFGVHSP